MREIQEKAQVCGIYYGSEKSGQVKNGGAEEGARCRIEFQEETGEELVKVGWARGANGMEKTRPRLTWEDCVKTHSLVVGGEWCGSGDRWWIQ